MQSSKGWDPKLRADCSGCRLRQFTVTRDTRPPLVRRVPPDGVSAAFAQGFATFMPKVSLEIAQPDHEMVRSLVTVATARRWAKGGSRVLWYSCAIPNGA